MKPIDLATARGLVAALVQPSYDGPGTFYVSEFGHTGYGLLQLYVGAREWLVDRDRAFLTVGDPVYLVNLDTGAITEAAYLEVRDLLDGMEPFGDWPADVGHKGPRE